MHEEKPPAGQSRMKPFFSVIIPTYNRCDMLIETIQSVFRQAWTDYEVLVVDDGSTDNTISVLSAHSDRIKVFEQPNSGPSAARNLGMKNATGMYIAFLDSDDLWFPWTLENYAFAITTHNYPSGILGTPYDFHDIDVLASVNRTPTRCEYFPDTLTHSRKDLWRATPVSVFRTDCLESGVFFRKQTECFEDLDLWLRLGTSHGFVHVLEPPALAYRKHADCVSSRASRCREGVLSIMACERNGEYPGGRARAGDRRRIIGRLARAAAVGLTRRRWLGWGLEIYMRSWTMQLRLGRWRYLAGFPIEFLNALLRGGKKVGV